MCKCRFAAVQRLRYYKRGVCGVFALSLADEQVFGPNAVRSGVALVHFSAAGGTLAIPRRCRSIVPASLRDLIYAAIARVRHRMFRRPERACPVVAPERMKRFAP